MPYLPDTATPQGWNQDNRDRRNQDHAQPPVLTKAQRKMTARPIDLICAPKPTSAKVAPAAQNGGSVRAAETGIDHAA